jgi:hypothetical protein
MSAQACESATWPPQGLTIVQSTSPAFLNATQRWNGYGAPKFDEAVTPSTAAEVMQVVS